MRASGALPDAQRCVLVHRYFWPDSPPYAHILREVAERLAETGLAVTVLTCQPSYGAASGSAPKVETLPSGVQVRRHSIRSDRHSSGLKLLNLISFCIWVAWQFVRLRRVKIVMAATTPPILVAATCIFLAKTRGAAFIYHKQDIYPDVAEAGPGMNAGLATILRRLDSLTDRCADRVVVLSTDMKATVKSRGAQCDRVIVINNFDPWETPETQLVRESSAEAPLRVCFAGNLGRFQNLPLLVRAMVALEDASNVTFDIVGEGSEADSLRAMVESAGAQKIQFHGYVPPLELARMLRCEIDVGVVSLSPGVVYAAYPSKTLTYLRQGVPILALVEEDSSLASGIKQSGAGWVVQPASEDDLVKVLREIALRPDDARSRRLAAQSLHHETCSKADRLSEWEKLFYELLKERR